MTGKSCFCKFIPWIGVITAASLIGCSSKEGGDLIPVSGRIVLPDGPIAGIGVSFWPDASKGNTTQHVPTGSTDAEGKYELRSGNQKGAPPGWYKVVLTPPSPEPVGGSMPKPTPPPFANKYLDIASTDLQVEVKSGAAPETYDLKVEK